ncbi:hypothetical protein [Marinobacterium rhizophilum]|uniref:hypothetical protein n=1 Tax=Marinobacterium rhizophilum TaxID=420402 RepID=UPI00036136CA|nr:hypothetical protein [Marinobacterium rhizophilum]
MMNTAYKQLRNLIHRLSLVRTSRLSEARSQEHNADSGALSGVQNDMARAARKNPWILAG